MNITNLVFISTIGQIRNFNLIEGIDQKETLIVILYTPLNTTLLNELKHTCKKERKKPSTR